MKQKGDAGDDAFMRAGYRLCRQKGDNVTEDDLIKLVQSMADIDPDAAVNNGQKRFGTR